MKKTININLAGQAFIIDEVAYDSLHGYFEALKAKFSIEGERREIIADIEARVAELLAQRLDKTKIVVSEEDVAYATALLGRPEDIAGETTETTSGKAQEDPSTKAESIYMGSASRKLFRDTDDKKVGGVISGLAHYFGWGDPTWIRIGVLGILLVSMFAHLGVGFPLVVVYFILLIVIPKAQTSAEKLQMRGRPVTIHNIEREVRDAMNTATSSVHTLVKDDSIVQKLLNIALMVLKAIGKIALIGLLFFCSILLLLVISSFFGLSFLSSSSLTDFTHLLVASRYMIMGFNVGVLLVGAVPVIAIMYYALLALTGNRSNNKMMGRVFGSLFLVGLLLLGAITFSVAKNFANGDTNVQKVQLMSPPNGTLYVQLADTLGQNLNLRNDAQDDNNWGTNFNFNGISKTDYGFAFSDLKLELVVSPDSNYYVEKVINGRGSSTANANSNIQNIRYKFSQTDTTLNLDDRFEIPRGAKWRAQKIKLRVYIPEGKQVTFSQNIEQLDAMVKGNDYFDEESIAGHTFVVEKSSIKCTDCSVAKTGNNDNEDGTDEDSDPSKATANSTSNNGVTIHTGNTQEHLKDVTVKINQSGVAVTGKTDQNQKVKVRVNENGLTVDKTDSAGDKKK
jgi:hypothetical protein